MSVRIRIAKGVTWGRTGFRVTTRIGGGTVSVGKSGIFARAALGPLRYFKSVR